MGELVPQRLWHVLPGQGVVEAMDALVLCLVGSTGVLFSSSRLGGHLDLGQGLGLRGGLRGTSGGGGGGGGKEGGMRLAVL